MSGVFSSRKPGFGSWLIAGAGVVGVAGLIGTIHLFVTGLRLAQIQAELRDYLGTQPSVQVLLTEARFRPVLSADDKKVRRAIDLAGLIDLRDYDSALERIEQIEGAAETLAPILETLADQKTERAKIEAREESLEKQYALFDETYLSMRSELAGLIRVVLPQQKADEKPELLFYEKGVLAGLPVLEGVPDGVSDYAALAKFGTAPSGEEEMISADDLHLRLEVLRTQADTISREVKALDAEADRTSDTEEKLKESMRSLADQAETESRAIIFKLARPAVHPWVPAVYNALKEPVSRYIFNVPELAVR